MKLKAVLLIMLSLSLILSACAGGEAQSSEPAAESSAEESKNAEESGEFVTDLRFIVTSDNHVGDASSATAVRLKQLFQSAYAYAEKQDYKTVDAFIAVGDITNNGYASELAAWKSVVDANIKEETQVITVSGNHEFYGYGHNDDYKNGIDSELNKHITIKGYHFIGISTYKEGDYSDSLDWLSENLESASKDAPEKPIITFQHHHIKNTVYTSAEWNAVQSAQLNSIYSKYSNVINFSGHSHAPINNPASVYQKDYTLFGTGTLAYFEMASGMTYGSIPPNADKAAQYYIVEISTDNRVRVLPYNLITNDFFKTPDGSKQLVYTIDDLIDKSKWLYTDARKESNAAPEFASEAAITVDKVGTTTASITIPQASDDNCVYSYKIVCTAKDGSVKEFNYFSEYYFEPMPETLTFGLSALKSGSEYTVEVFPKDVFGKLGEPISATLATEEAVSIEYSSENKVNFVGTFTNFDSAKSLTASGANLAYGGKVNGDIFVGTWNSAAGDGASKFELVKNGGYKGSAALAVSSGNRDNQGLYIFGTEANKNTTAFPSAKYLRVWVDFSDVEFRKANFGLVAPNGDLYTTDESDYVPDLEFMYLADGASEWKTYLHGGDGCFGVEQGTQVKDFKGWLAFPIEDFTYRYGTGSGGASAGEAYPYTEIAGVYMFWNYSSETASGKAFIIDELQIVEDYKVFEEFEG